MLKINSGNVEQGAFNPAHLVPGISGPPDFLFRGRRMFYRDTQNYRLGRNHNKIFINTPLYAKTYVRDGTPPTRLNMKNAPNYYSNSFNGPIPYVDEKRPREKLQVLESNAVDLEPLQNFYNNVLESEAHRQRFIDTLVLSLEPVTPPVLQNAIKMLYLIDLDLGKRVSVGLEVALKQRRAQQAAAAATPPPNLPIRNTPTAEAAPKTHFYPKNAQDNHK
ncbi:hypothetical protein PYW08_003393 [Mythimna loreyi]|uniref:Uncharacterized protein n=1 Tax=Mythimna loreyi TaxID=667449 RepID=A0ACC2QS57_9NEOP|nr:hypothetical protein PYW08_003393 [Mythimna loreyi]